VVADNGEKGLTFAVEPIKLALSETLEATINDKSKAFPVMNLYTVSQTMLPLGRLYSLIRLSSVENKNATSFSDG
jgi:hypothetical protein